jgi:RNA polymerase sigma-70 factor (ECF subfamily)
MKTSKAVHPHPDKKLVERMLAGDREGFDEFFQELVPRLNRFVASRLGGAPETIREIVQSSVCIAIDSLENYRGEAALLSWICGIARYEVIAHLRRKKATGQVVEWVEESPEIQATLETLSGVLENPESNLERAEVASLVHLAMDYLPTRYSRALEWKYCDGLSDKEIAGRLDIGPKAAESILTRARGAFREAFVNLAGEPLVEAIPTTM